MSSLLDLLELQAPNVQTRTGLILLDLAQPNCHSDNVKAEKNKSDRLLSLIPNFRDVGTVIWVQSNLANHNNRNLSSESQQFRHWNFLINEKKDLQVIAPQPSAFESTSLIMILRSKLITEMFIAGSLSSGSVYATAIDAARYGIKVTLVEDCLVHHDRKAHAREIRRLVMDVGAETVMSTDFVASKTGRPPQLPDLKANNRLAKHDISLDERNKALLHSGQAAMEISASAAFEVDSSDEDDGETLPSLDDFRPSKRPPVPDLRDIKSHRQSPTIKKGELSKRSTTPKWGYAPEEVRKDNRNNSTPAYPKGCSKSSNKPRTKADSSRKNFEEPHLDMMMFTNEAELHDSERLETSKKLASIKRLSTTTMMPWDESKPTDKSQQACRRPLFGLDKETESAGSFMTYDLLPPALSEIVFEGLVSEIEWQRMVHQTGHVPRLVCCQGAIDAEGNMPVYRHPSDRTIPVQTWTPWVERVKTAAEKQVGHPLNHVLIQLYRSGTDYINEHSDKTLDIVHGSNIVNVSFGAQRTMRLRTKRSRPHPDQTAQTIAPRTTHRIPLLHNSMLTMSLSTNAKYLHGINADKRPGVELNEAEKAFAGQRISLTFRYIGTFLNANSTLIWGQGAVGKTRDVAQPVVNGDVAAGETLLCAFGTENSASTIKWDEIYGLGSNVLHLKDV
ncbi:Hypothetical protein R9X50_00445500 [Acrodontium crateriforme]|uniref:Fe2OG dioxygenase domain-containing protein n=1 Tax=Acrodontium crateriforme TaxID=150365 RepID=A0AAQ3MB05_9PEZI|nr:Hypothetical protein R9X50_00445500 [Acrodontium crateriforme]